MFLTNAMDLTIIYLPNPMVRARRLLAMLDVSAADFPLRKRMAQRAFQSETQWLVQEKQTSRPSCFALADHLRRARADRGRGRDRKDQR